MNARTYSTVLIALLSLVMLSVVANAQTVPLTLDYVEINGDKYTSNNVDIADKLERGEDLDLTVKITAMEDVENAQIEAYISGYRYSTYERSLVSDVTRTFDLEANTSDKYDLKLQVPLKMDMKDTKLRIRVSNEDDESFEQVYELRIRGVDDSKAIQVKGFTVSPSNIIEAGRAASFKVQVKNYGDNDLDDVHVKVSIPRLGIADDETLDNIDVDESETFEELLLRVPTCAQPGTYEVVAEVTFDEYERITKTMDLVVVEGGACTAQTSEPETKTVITVPESQDITLGSTGIAYPVLVSNMGKTAKTYTLSASGMDAWGTARFDPSAVLVVAPGSVKTVYLYITPKDDVAAGTQFFQLSVSAGDEVKQVLLSANLLEDTNSASYDGLRRGLEIGLVVLVIILILLGLIIGFSKLRGGKHDNDEETQTYY